jgi:SAM-dependent MidA family methyltransferase
VSARPADPARPDPVEGERARESALRARLRRAAGPKGLLRSDRFLEIALYEPGLGYYTHPGVAIGRAGDFYTASHASDLFAATLAKRLGREFDRLGRPPIFTVVEVGAGDGHLAERLVGPLTQATGGARLDYRLVERAPALKARAIERFSARPPPEGAEVSFAEALASDGPFRGAVVANELLDALPFRRAVAREGRWHELFVRVDEEALSWSEGPEVGGEDAAAVETGTIDELPSAALAWIRELADHLEEGCALLLDYGGGTEELRRRFPGGTLAAVRHHRPVADPLEHPGLSDLSAFVDFDRIRTAAGRAGLSETAYRPQAEALVAWGLEELARTAAPAASAAEAVQRQLGVKNLLFGFERFRVLELCEGRRERSRTPP